MPSSSRPLELPISLVIPCGADSTGLAPVLAALRSGSCWPAEVLVVDSLQQLDGNVPVDEPFCSLVRVIPATSPLYPGEARNQACHAASCDWIAFLDLNTLPSPQWLEDIYATALKHSSTMLSTGSTYYRGHSWQQRLFITATYGERPFPTLPGSLVHRSVFHVVGLFLPGIRAGEDTDWLLRVRQFSIAQVTSSTSPLLYTAVPVSLAQLTRKWFRNYRSYAPVLYHLEAHKSLYLLLANLFILFIAFSWNSLVADWRESSLLYFANITKTILAFIVLCYLLIRGLVMPLRRGSAFNTVLPLRWLAVALVCLAIDSAKLLAFITPRRVFPPR